MYARVLNIFFQPFKNKIVIHSTEKSGWKSKYWFLIQLLDLDRDAVSSEEITIH